MIQARFVRVCLTNTHLIIYPSVFKFYIMHVVSGHPCPETPFYSERSEKALLGGAVVVKLGVLVLLMACAIYAAGCGGSSGSDTTSTAIRIETTRFVPKNLNVQVNDSVTWINASSVPHQVISGTLLPVSNPQILAPISIASNNVFVPENITANLGDTVRWRNDTGRQFTMDILDDANVLIATLVFGQGEVIGFSGFPTGGIFTFQERNNLFFSGTVTVFGVVPNQVNIRFKSQVLINGDTFSVQFTTPGTFPFFAIDPADPARSFLTGTINVQ